MQVKSMFFLIDEVVARSGFARAGKAIISVKNNNNFNVIWWSFLKLRVTKKKCYKDYKNWDWDVSKKYQMRPKIYTSVVQIQIF